MQGFGIRWALCYAVQWPAAPCIGPAQFFRLSTTHYYPVVPTFPSPYHACSRYSAGACSRSCLPGTPELRVMLRYAAAGSI